MVSRVLAPALALLLLAPLPSAPAGPVPPGTSPRWGHALERSVRAADYQVPVEGVVLRLFDAPVVRWGRGHRGVDLSAEAGAAVRSPAAGVVTFAGVVVDRGVVTVTHPDGLRSSFEPVAAPLPVGTAVTAGEALAEVAASAHCAGRQCVHWGVRSGTEYVDPLGLLGDTTVVLLP